MLPPWNQNTFLTVTHPWFPVQKKPALHLHGGECHGVGGVDEQFRTLLIGCQPWRPWHMEESPSHD